jgi:hypothetical protein
MAELAVDDDEPDALSRHLHSMGVAKLMRSEPSAHASARR